MEHDDEPTQLEYAHALTAWGDAGGYNAEVLWDTVTVAALGLPYDACKYRELTTLSGGEQKRLALEALLRGPDEVLLLDEPDNYLDVPAKCWLEERLIETPKTVLFVSHDRELLARVADRIVTVEGGMVWVHGGGFASYHDAREARHDRMAELRRRWEEEHARLKELVRTLQQQAKYYDSMAPKYRVMLARLQRFEAAGPPPEKPPEQRVSMRLAGGPDRRARRHVRRFAADWADPSVRRRDLLRRTHRSSGSERGRQVAFPAAAGRRDRCPHR
jgi:ATPase subunit of ABC transporter with duplicated ATPase domains